MSSLKKVKLSKSSDDTFQIAHKLALKINAPRLIGLLGELGTGKTLFVKGFANGLGVQELVTSPTFLGISEYYSGKDTLVHMDFYKKVQEEKLIKEYLKKPSIVLIEWAGNYKEVFNKDLNLDIRVYIEYVTDKEQNILNNERYLRVIY